MNLLSLKILLTAIGLSCLLPLKAQTIHISPTGKDTWPGTAKRPVATLNRAQQLARQYTSSQSVTILLDDGVYYLPNTLQFSEKDNKTYPATLTFRALHEGKAILSGGKELHLTWKEETDGIFSASLTNKQVTSMDQLYINGQRQRMARFPNATPAEGKNVFDTWALDHSAKPNSSQDPLDPERIARWEHPKGGFLHTMHHALWGDMHWHILGKSSNQTLQMEGGWQNNRPSKMHPLYRMVENIREELDVPGEWYFDASEKKLYYQPLPGTNLQKAKIEIVRLTHLIEWNGSQEEPVKGIVLDGLVFRHTNRTFMENKEPLLRSDWTIYRGGALFFNGAIDCTVKNCEFDQTGGNAIFVNNYNRRITIQGCYIHHAGANGIAFVGDPKAVRSPLFRYGPQDYNHLDHKSGPKTNNFPQECTVEDCLITQTGRDEKQTAPVQISMSYRIRISHCSIYDVPRAGININEGTFGGHLIEHCDVFNTVLETNDHGSFNSWGRDRYWTPNVAEVSNQMEETPNMHQWDMLEPNTIRNSRWRCDHGWDIDLDDGSSHYHIYNNLLLRGGLKLREGYDRIVTNNILVNNSLYPHVWFRNSGDVFKHNIVFDAYKPAIMQSAIASNGCWGKELDYNLFAASEAKRTKFTNHHADIHSIVGNPLFVDASSGNFNVQEDSPAWNIGFHNFPMDEFGVRNPKLKALAKTPTIPAVTLSLTDAEILHITRQKFMGATLKLVSGDELSAFGVSYDQTALAFEEVPPQSVAAQIGLKNGDLLQTINGKRVTDFTSLQHHTNSRTVLNQISIIREQQFLQLQVTTPTTSKTF